MRFRNGLLFAAACLAAWAVTACGTASCGDGATLQDGVCVPHAPTCGAGTALQGQICVLVTDTASGADAAADSVADATDATVVAPDACQPVCALVKPCGSDGCGGSCGTCADGQVCGGGSCYPIPGCIPDCISHNCGDDGCGGSCGTCLNNQACVAGVCGGKCVPNCLDKDCGADGCGGSCGTCAAGQVCPVSQLCVPTSWTCDPVTFGHDAQCNCGCGAADPDCENPFEPTVGCEPYHACVAGVCTSTIPATWTCDKPAYHDKLVCDCGCGAPDPDCALAGALIVGCALGQVCLADGSCGACVPDCTNKVCGDDGCGGSCGDCPPQAQVGDPMLACINGKCVDGCAPSPILCATNNCGSDGCGGSCGNCAFGEFCDLGVCAISPGMSCKGFCKGMAPGGCSCDAGCVSAGACCPDFIAECTCIPQCTGKTCGDDGCGGYCGDCAGTPNAPYCSAVGQCAAQCEPQCAGKQCGGDGCGGSCGTCPDGGSCNGQGLCVPKEWYCLDNYYADGSVCDCSCGAPDPDCLKIALTMGCPKNAACSASTGICDMPFCGADEDCSAPNWCVGEYPVGGGLRKGICQFPDPLGSPVGSPCTTDSSCANGLCLNGDCRAPCQSDSQCGAGGTCVGFAKVQGLTQKPTGVATACLFTASNQACTSQAMCTAATDACLAYVHPSTLKPNLRCGTLPSVVDELQKCDGPDQCDPGLVCASGTCNLPCPAGAADCPANHTCVQVPWLPGLVAATKLPVCLPNGVP